MAPSIMHHAIDADAKSLFQRPGIIPVSSYADSADHPLLSRKICILLIVRKRAVRMQIEIYGMHSVVGIVLSMRY